MSRFAIEGRADFSAMALLAGWFTLSTLPGLIVWMLGLGVPRMEFFPVPMISAVSYQSAAYASIVTAVACGFLAIFHLNKAIRTRGLNKFVRFIALIFALGMLALLGGFNPFSYNNLPGRVARTLLDLGDWVTLSIVGTVASFAFAFCLSIALRRQE